MIVVVKVHIMPHNWKVLMTICIAQIYKNSSNFWIKILRGHQPLQMLQSWSAKLTTKIEHHQIYYQLNFFY